MTSNIFDEFQMWKLSGDKMNSMTYWYEKIKSIPELRMPRTQGIPLDRKSLHHGMIHESNEESVTKYLETLKDELINTASNDFAFPVFMRTSEMSVKHSWSETCFVESKERVWRNFCMLIEDNYLMTDQVPDAIYLREFIPMESYFTGWGRGLPINKEVRTFFKDDKIMCIHPYWPKDAMVQARITDPDWESKYTELCNITEEDSTEIIRMLNQVMKHFHEAMGWSCDFSKGKDGKWYLIDMAIYPVSYHYPECPNMPQVRTKDGKLRSANN